MWIYSHTNYTLKGYTRLTHEAVQFTKDAVREVTEEVGDHLLGTYPLQFCRVTARQEAREHSCPLGEHPEYRNRRLARPPRDRMMVTRRS